MTKPRSSRRDEDLKATADSIASSAERVAELEAEKVRLAPDHPRTKKLALEIDALVDGMDQESEVQRALTEDAIVEREARPN